MTNQRDYYLLFNDIELIIGLFVLIKVNVQFLGMKFCIKEKNAA